MRILHYSFGFCLFLSSTIFSSAPLSLSFIDVGQGNCTVVVAKDKNVPALVIDCGSIESSTKGIDVDKNVESIADIIRADYVVPNQSKNPLIECYLVVSHPDKDHVNKFNAAFRRNFSMKNIKVTKIWLGGKRECYIAASDIGSTFITEWEKYLGEQLPKGEMIFPSNKGGRSIDAVTPIWGQEGATLFYEILPCLSCVAASNPRHKGSCKTNANSLIVRISYRANESTFVALIMGDATGESTDHLLQLQSKGKLILEKVNVMGVSHHGASASSSNERCNDPKWIDVVKPRTAIFSSGVHNGYCHPAIETIRSFARYADELSEDEEGNKKFCSLLTFIKPETYIAETEDFIFRTFFCNHLGACVLNRRLLGTLSLGTITIEVNENCGENYSKTDPNSSITTVSSTSALIKLFLWCLSTLAVKENCGGFNRLDFSSLSLEQEDNASLMSELLQTLKEDSRTKVKGKGKSFNGLPGLDLSSNALSDTLVQDLVLLLEAKDLLGVVSLEDCKLTNDQKVLIAKTILSKTLSFDDLEVTIRDDASSSSSTSSSSKSSSSSDSNTVAAPAASGTRKIKVVGRK